MSETTGWPKGTKLNSNLQHRLENEYKLMGAVSIKSWCTLNCGQICNWNGSESSSFKKLRANADLIFMLYTLVPMFTCVQHTWTLLVITAVQNQRVNISEVSMCLLAPNAIDYTSECPWMGVPLVFYPPPFFCYCSAFLKFLIKKRIKKILKV